LGIDLRWGAAGLTLSAGVAGWVEFALLRSRLNRRIGRTGVPAGYLARLWGAAGLAAAAAWAARLAAGIEAPIPRAIVTLGVYGGAYFAAAAALGIVAPRAVLRRAGSLRR